MSDLRLVVWDLDHTLWEGVLSEGPVRVRPEPARLIPSLARSGIPSAVCSNNDPAPADEQLRASGLADWVTLVRVGWAPKVDLLRGLVEASGLRPECVVLVDDLARIREEAHRQIGVATLGPNELAELHATIDETRDPDLERLQRFHVLDRRDRARTAAQESDRSAFLEASCIRVCIEDADLHVDRLLDLVSRARRLNFTRSPLSEYELRYMLATPRFEVGAVRVTDVFGDYGITGFYAVDRTQGTLRHFAFSCSLLHMGIEQAVFYAIGQPRVDVTPGTTVPPPPAGAAPWVTLETAGAAASASPRPRAREPSSATRVVLRGECDLLAMGGYLGGASDVVWEVLDQRDGLQVYGGSSIPVLLDATTEVGRRLHAEIPWLPDRPSAAFGDPPGVLVLSLWVDVACIRYRHRATGVTLPSYVRFDQDTDPATWQQWWGDAAPADWFLTEFDALPPVTAGELTGAVVALRTRLASATRLLLLNCAEVETPWRYPTGELQHARHQRMNAAIDRVVADTSGVELLDVRPIVRAPADLDSSAGPMLAHYDRLVYVTLAAELERLLTAGAR